MTERERWIVYPLLFLALGTSLRGKIGLAEDESITKKLEVVDAESGKAGVVIKDGVIIAKKLVVGELVANERQQVIECENLVVKKQAIVGQQITCENLLVNNQAKAKQQFASEVILVDPDNEKRILAKLFKDPKSASGTFYLVNESGAPIVGMRSTSNNVGRMELWQQIGNYAQIRQAINADGKPGVWEAYPIAKPKAEPMKKKPAADEGEQKSDPKKPNESEKQNDE